MKSLQVVHAFLCDGFVQHTDKKHTIVGMFDLVETWETFPFTYTNFHVVVFFEPPETEIEVVISVKIFDEKGHKLKGVEYSINTKELNIVNTRFPKVKFKKPGKYKAVVYYNGIKFVILHFKVSGFL